MKLRVEAQSHAAHKVAAALEAMPGIARVLYPHLDSHPQAALCRKQMTLGGTMVTFEVEGGKKKAFDLLRNLGIIDISNNLGDAKSLMTHPASTTHRNIGAEARALMGITDGMLRLSVGLEDVDDLIGDLTQAMKG
jgi:O-succinylhomoserine sulfhydrylase